MQAVERFLVYHTPTYTSIQEKKLAMVYYILLLLVAIYAIFNIVIYKGYFEFEEIVGTVTFNLEEPSIDQTYDYCLTSKCEQRDITEVAQYTTSGGYFISWKMTEWDEVLQCTNKIFGKSCKWTNTSAPNSFYIPGFEDYSLIIKHYVKAPVFAEEHHVESSHYEGNSHNLSGILFNDAKKPIKKFLKGEEDKMLLRDLFTSLTADTNRSKSLSSLYEKGVSLQVDLKYNNRRCNWEWHCAFGSTEISYRYVVRSLEKGTTITKLFEYSPTSRKRIVLYGIEIDVLQSGKLGRFSIHALFTTFVTNFGLLAIFVAALDIVVLYLLPHSAFYRTKVYRFVTRASQDKKDK